MDAKVHRSIRLTRTEADEIARLARNRGMSFTRYILDSALERLPEHETEANQRLNRLERRIDRLEQRAELAY